MPFAEYRYSRSTTLDLPMYQLMKLAVAGIGVIFAALGMGEAVYRIIFFEFDGAKDRLPIESMFGIVFAILVARFLLKRHRQHTAAHEALEIIRKRNEKIGAAVGAITPLPIPGQQQAIRVIREEVDFIRWKLSDTLPE